MRSALLGWTVRSVARLPLPPGAGAEAFLAGLASWCVTWTVTKDPVLRRALNLFQCFAVAILKFLRIILFFFLLVITLSFIEHRLKYIHNYLIA